MVSVYLSWDWVKPVRRDSSIRLYLRRAGKSFERISSGLSVASSLKGVEIFFGMGFDVLRVHIMEVAVGVEEVFKGAVFAVCKGIVFIGGYGVLAGGEDKEMRGVRH